MKKRVRLALAVIAILLLTSSSSLAQINSAEATRRTANKRVNIHGRILGSIELPSGFRGYMTNDYMDAWAGYIESPDTGFKMNWRAGTIVYVLEDRKKDIVWQRNEGTGNDLITRASLKGKVGQQTLVTKIGWLEFSALIRNPADERTFASLIDSYQRTKCETCLSLPRWLNRNSED
jgi:hypothetical protein